MSIVNFEFTNSRKPHPRIQNHQQSQDQNHVEDDRIGSWDIAPERLPPFPPVDFAASITLWIAFATFPVIRVNSTSTVIHTITSPPARDAIPLTGEQSAHAAQ